MLSELKAVFIKKSIVPCVLCFGVAIATIISQYPNLYRVLFLDHSLNYVANRSSFLFMMFFAVLLLIYVAVQVFNMVTGKSVKAIKQYLQQHPETTLENIEHDFKHATKFESTAFLGEKFLIYVDTAKAGILRLEELLWVYYSVRTKSGFTTIKLSIFTWKRQYFEIEFKHEKTVESLLQRLETMSFPIVLGYSNQLKDLFNKDRQQFEQLAHTRRESRSDKIVK